MELSKGRIVAASTAATITAALFVALVWPVWPAIAVEVDGHPNAGGSLALDSDEQFAITFIHSLDLLPVQDWYVVREGEIVQDSARLISFGAGMGHIHGQGTGHADGRWWEIRDLDRPIGDLVLRVGRSSVDHRLRYPGGELALSACWPRERVTIRASKMSTLARVFGSSDPECR